MTKKDGENLIFFIINIDIVCTLLYNISMKGGKLMKKKQKKKPIEWRDLTINALIDLIIGIILIIIGKHIG